MEFLTDLKLDAMNFRANVRTYNNLLSFCSIGAKFDQSVWGPLGHRIVRLQGAVYHNIGALLPETGVKPKFSQIYIMEGSPNEMAKARVENGHGKVDENVVLRLQVSDSLILPATLFTYHDRTSLSAAPIHMLQLIGTRRTGLQTMKA